MQILPKHFSDKHLQCPLVLPVGFHVRFQVFMNSLIPASMQGFDLHQRLWDASSVIDLEWILLDKTIDEIINEMDYAYMRAELIPELWREKQRG